MASLWQQYPKWILWIWWNSIVHLWIISLHVVKEYNLFAQLDIFLPRLYQIGLFVFCPRILTLHHSVYIPVQNTRPPNIFCNSSDHPTAQSVLVWDSKDSLVNTDILFRNLYWDPLPIPTHMKPCLPHSPNQDMQKIQHYILLPLWTFK